MKKLILLFIVAMLSFTAMAQQKQPEIKKHDSVVMLTITIDTTVYKQVITFIQENISGQTLTGRMVLNSILTPLSKYKPVWVYTDNQDAKQSGVKPKEPEKQKPAVTPKK